MGLKCYKIPRLFTKSKKDSVYLLLMDTILNASIYRAAWFSSTLTQQLVLANKLSQNDKLNVFVSRWPCTATKTVQKRIKKHYSKCFNSQLGGFTWGFRRGCKGSSSQPCPRRWQLPHQIKFKVSFLPLKQDMGVSKAAIQYLHQNQGCKLLTFVLSTLTETALGELSFSFFTLSGSNGPGFLLFADAYKWLTPKLS